MKNIMGKQIKLVNYLSEIKGLFKVGYGDKIPLTDSGRVVACLCALFGVLIFGLPIPVLVRSFHKFYNIVNNNNNKQTASPKTEKPSLNPTIEEKSPSPSPVQNMKIETVKEDVPTHSPHHHNPHMPRLTRRRTKSLLFKQESLYKERNNRNFSC